MKPKGRYNIRLAKKKGVKITKADPSKPKQFQKQIDAYHDILLETTTRDGFSAHSKSFYENMVKTLHENKKGDLYLAQFEDKIIAGLITTYYNKTTTYYYGASGNLHRNLMAPYLLQWAAIKDAKAKNHTSYDFLGIAPENAASHPWKGVTAFKTKFGGTRTSFTKAHDYAFKPLLYLFYSLHKKIRWNNCANLSSMV